MQWYLMGLEKYFFFEGRSTREEYWMFQLVHLGIFSLVLTADLILFGKPALVILYVIATIVPNLTLSIRRLHDLDFSGWWLLIGFIPFGKLGLYIMFAFKGSPEDNVYGPSLNPTVSGPDATLAPAEETAYEIECPHCGKTLDVQARDASREIQCASCAGPIVFSID